MICFENPEKHSTFASTKTIKQKIMESKNNKKEETIKIINDLPIINAGVFAVLYGFGYLSATTVETHNELVLILVMIIVARIGYLIGNSLKKEILKMIDEQ